jgi:membrane protein YdbS with pleckstrin-like domain
MGYVKRNLMHGERVAATARLHVVIFLPAVMWLLAAVALWIATTFVSGIPVYLLGIGAIGFALVAIWKALKAGVRWLTSEFAVTNKRVIVKEGLIKRESVEMLLGKVETVQVTQGILGRLVGYGTIVITGTGGSPNPYHKISSPMHFRRAVQRQVEENS